MLINSAVDDALRSLFPGEKKPHGVLFVQTQEIVLLKIKGLCET